MRCRNRLWKKQAASPVTVIRPGEEAKIIPLSCIRKPTLIEQPEIVNERDNERYSEWRTAILKRDRKTCSLCGSKEWIQVHHIERWADNPAKRYDLQNGVCLCSICHAKHHGPQMQPFPAAITAALLEHIHALYGDGSKQLGALTNPSRRTNRPGSWQEAQG